MEWSRKQGHAGVRLKVAAKKLFHIFQLLVSLFCPKGKNVQQSVLVICIYSGVLMQG
jgi:hypothetical protein